MLTCRTFGAYFINKPVPGLTAGPIDCQPFGPPGIRHYTMRDSLDVLIQHLFLLVPQRIG